MTNFFDRFDAADGGETGNYFDQFDSSADDQPSTKQNTSLVGDLGTDLKRGVQKLPGIATGLADIPVAALTNKRFVDETADKLGEATGFQPSQWAEEARDEYSPERQTGSAEIDRAWEEGTAVDVAGAYISNPGNIAGMAVESVPQMLAGGVLGRGALAAGRATGVIGAPTTAAQAATQGAIAGGVGEGAVIAGGTMDQIDDSVEPRRAAAASAGAGVAGAALGVLGAKAAQRLGVLDAESAIAGGAGQVAGEAPGLARRVAGGALSEGVLEELPQSVTETMFQNWAEEKDLTDGLARAAVEGTLAGSAIGAGVNVLPARKRSEEMGLDPNAGPLSAAAVTAVDSEQALLPAPERLALPAPDQTLYADGQGNVSEQGPAREVDREQRPVPGREPSVREFGPGMDQQVERGTVPVSGELMPAAQPDAPAQDSGEPRTFDARPERQGIPDLRESSINVDAEGNAVPGKIPTRRPAEYVQGGRGMDQQAPVGKTYSNVLAAKNAIQRAGSADVLEAVQVGPKQFEVRAKPAAPEPAKQTLEQFAEASAARQRDYIAGERARMNAIADGSASQDEMPVYQRVAPAEARARLGELETMEANVAQQFSPEALRDIYEIPAKSKPTAKPAAIKPATKPVDRQSLPEVLRFPKKMVVARMAKAAGIKKGSPGYDDAVGRLENDYERQVDDAQAALPFEQFNALNKESPEGVNRQAWTQLRKEREIETVDEPATPKAKPAKSVKGADIDGDWASFSKDSGTLNIPRAEMPQIKAEHRGAMVNFLNARGVAHAEETIAADKLKPTQAEYSTKKVEAAKAFEGGDRSILISSDGHVLDGHHQWLAKRDAGEVVKVIRLDAPIRQLLDTVAEFPSATTDDAMTENAPQYSRQSYRQGKAGDGSRAVQLRMQLQRLTGGWQNAPDIKVVQSIKDLPDAQRRQVERDGAFDVEGMFADGQVYLVADNLRDVKHAAFVLQHEVLGHAGLQGAYGKRLTPLLMSLYNNNAELKSQADSLVQRFGYQPAVAMEEVLADMAAAGTIQEQDFWPRLLTAMRNALRSIGMNLSWSDGDIQTLLANARGYIVNGRRRPGARDAFSRDGRSGRGPEIADEQGRLLASNGKPSKLNQKQWHQVRLPSFKQWFGNWQGLAAEQRMDAMKPLKLRMPDAWQGMSEDQKLAGLKEALKGMVSRSEVLHHAELGDVRMYMGGIKKATHSSADPAKKAVLAKLRESFEGSVYFGYKPDSQGRPDILAFHRLMMPIDLDGQGLVAIFTLKESRQGQFFYNAVTVARKEEAPAAYPGEVSRAQITTPAFTGASVPAASPRDMTREGQRSTSANTETAAFLRQPLRLVNPDDVSKVTDGNGEPLVLYHGTGEQFTVFDQSRAGRSTGHSTAPLGIFLTADSALAKSYAEKATDGMPGLANVLPLFASIKNPYRMSLAESQELDSPQKAMAFRQKLEREGYDGVQLQGSPVWVAFYNNQVKSATNNTGAFDEVDPDIRYRRSGQWVDEARDLFNRATGPAPLERNDPFAAENRRLREGEQTLWQKAKKQFARQFAPGGLLPDSVFAEKITRDSEFQAVEFDVRHLSGGLNKAVKADYGVDLDNLTAEQMKPLAEALAGKVDPAIPEATRVAIVAMRQYIDSLSGEYLSILQKQVEANMEGADQVLIDKITGNLGSYVNRSYQAFDDPKWFKTVPTEVVNAARVYLAKGYTEQGETAAEAARLADVTVNEMLKNGTAYDSMGGFIAESKLGAKDLTVLIKRKEIAPEIRALLGEYMDPRLNFAKSATKMGRMVWNQRFLDRVLEFGMGTLFFEGKNRPADATTQIAGEQSESYAPLNGLWTFPEVAQSFQDALGKEQMSDLYRTIVRLNGMVKYGKTILSPTTAMRNWQSAMFFSLANGHFDLTQMKKSWAALREQVTQNATGEDLTYLRKLKQLGVVYDTPYAGEMMALLNDARMDELLSSKSGTGLKWLRKANQFAQGFYSFGDDFWKIIGYENEKASLLEAGIPVAEAETMAAERIRNTYPTYSMIGKAVQWLRRFPLAGTFVSFPSEIIRTTVGMMKLVNTDLKSDNPRIRALGRKRAAGMAMVSAGFYALSAMTAAAMGVGDDEEEAVRDLGPPWSRNSTFLYTGRDADGKLRYFDMSFLDPYGYWKRPLTAMMRDQPWEKAAASGISDMLSPFFGADITAGAIFEVMSNKKPTGGQVYNENAGSVDQLQDITNHMRKALQPGFFSNAERLYLAGTEARREGSGQPYDMRDEVVSLLGWRASTLDTKTGLYYRSFEFSDALSDARKTLTRTLRSSNNVSESDIRESKQAANAQYQQAFTEMSRLVSAAGKAGMSRSEIAQTLKTSGVAQRNIMALMTGRVPPMDISLAAQAKSVQQARAMRDNEHAAEIARRFRMARE